MPLRVRCPTGHKLIVPDDRAGRSLRCPRCGQVTVVPGERQEREQEAGARGQEPVASVEGSRRRDSSSVIDWPNSIAPPTAVATPELDPSAVDQVIASAVAPPPPIVEPPLTSVVKPKSRALPPRVPEPLPSKSSPVEPKRAEQKPQPKSIEPPPPPLPTPEIPAAEIATVVEAAEPEAEFLPAAPPSVIEPPPVAAPPAAVARSSEPPAPPPAAKVQVQPPPAEAEPPPVKEVKQPPVHPLVPDHAHQLAVYQLAAALVAAALFSIAPAVWDIVEYVQFPDSQLFVARWALVLLLLGAVQVAYTIYLVQLPDWTTVWVITIYLLFLAAIYAAVLGLVLISSESGLVVGALQLADKLAGGKAVLWCLCMVGVSTILAFFAGRLSARWHKTEMFIRQTGLARGSV